MIEGSARATADMLNKYPQNGLAYVTRGTAHALQANLDQVLKDHVQYCGEISQRHLLGHAGAT